MNKSKFDCNKCMYNHHCDETGEIEGSNGPAGFDIISVPGLLDSKVCLLPMISDKSHTLLRLHKHYKNNILPFSGGLLEQPNYYLQTMELLG